MSGHVGMSGCRRKARDGTNRGRFATTWSADKGRFVTEWRADNWPRQ